MQAQARVAERRSERLIEELLAAQGWDLRHPPAGELLTQQEYRDYPEFRDALAASSKSGPGSGVPEFILLDRESAEPIAVFEAKARLTDIELAVTEATGYGDALTAAGFRPLAIAVAGTADDTFGVRVLKRSKTGWQSITYDGNPVSWIPNREQLTRVRQSRGAIELRPAVPPIAVLKARAEEINGLLRESGLKDEYRPPAVGAIMLALWKSRGDLRRDPRFILFDINQSCEKAFWDAKKPDLAKSLRVDEANNKLAINARRICQILERLSITNLTAEHDYLGALYEEFFRYTGGNTIGQYFTPRHITALMADICEVSAKDVTLDPACGTGGFLIAAMQRIQRQSHLSREAVVKIVQKQLIGMDDEPVTAALCVANMVLRGDGTTGVLRADCFDDSRFPFDTATVVLMNPPFPHKKTDVPPETFIDRALKGLRHRGRAAIIVPSSLLVDRKKAAWRRSVLKQNTLIAAITLPTELFQPYASSNTAIIVMEHGTVHAPNRRVFFARVANDGFRLWKGVRIPRPGSQIPDVLAGLAALSNDPGFCASAPVAGDDWAPGAYIDAKPLSDDEFRDGVDELMRDKAAFAVRFAPQLAASLVAVEAGELSPRPYKRGTSQPVVKRTDRVPVIGELFSIYYGFSELENKDRLAPGDTPVISSTGADNGVYGFFDFPGIVQPPFVTAPRTGSIGEARVQEFPCAPSSDCLLLIPKPETPLEVLFVAAATIRDERWRFDYSRKLTPARIANFPLRLDSDLLRWVREQWERAIEVERAALNTFAEHQGALDRYFQLRSLAIEQDTAVINAVSDYQKRVKSGNGYPNALPGDEFVARIRERSTLGR
jgi:predicted RNA methylase